MLNLVNEEEKQRHQGDFQVVFSLLPPCPPAPPDDLQADTAGIETVKLEIRKIFQLLVTPLKRNGLYTGVELRQDAQGHCDEKQLLDEDMDGT